MRRAFILSVLVWLSVQDSITCLRIRELRVPANVAEGAEVVLGCIFDLQGQRLFSVKWFKDGQLFFHYRPGAGSSSVPDIRDFPGHGVSVDVARSGMETVTLLFMSRESAGEYRCDVTGESPDFRKASAKKNIKVDLLPDKDPEVTGLKEHYKVGAPLRLNCTSTRARPASRVLWFVNNMPVSGHHLHGPWYSRSVQRLDAYDTTLELSFGVMSSHFIYGVMTLRCEVILAPLYHKEVVFKYLDGKLMESTTKRTERTTTEPCTATITVDLGDTPEHLEPWSIVSPNTSKSGDGGGGAGFMRYSIVMLYLSILLELLI